MKSKKTLILAIIFALLTSIFAMSDDGANEPVVDKKEAKQEIVQEKQSVINEPVEPLKSTEEVEKSTQTVKDQFGIETGMTREELKKFKEEYLKKFPWATGFNSFKFKIDFNKGKEFDALGVNIFGITDTYKENTLCSNIIVIGSIIGKVHVAGRKQEAHSIQIDKILKGKDILINKLGKLPERIHFFHIDPLDNKIIVENQEGIYFFDRAEGMNVNKQWLEKIPYSTLLYLDETRIIYEKFYENYLDAKKMENSLIKNSKKKNPRTGKMVEKYKRDKDVIYEYIKFNETWEEVISNIEKILEINDTENFYNKKFKVEVKK